MGAFIEVDGVTYADADHYRELTGRELHELAAERRSWPEPTDRARRARTELSRRQMEEQALKVRGVLMTSLSFASSWSAALHAQTWEEWAALAALALDAHYMGAGLSVHLENHAGVTVSTLPRGSHWAFWPPAGEPTRFLRGEFEEAPVPSEYHRLAWTLADRVRYR